jgi:ACS family glucarate transporter-like MFS transporter
VDIGGGRAATVSGIMNFCGQFTAFLFVLFFGKVVDALGFAIPVYILAAVLLLGALLWFFVDPSKPLVVTENEKARPVLNQLEPA